MLPATGADYDQPLVVVDNRAQAVLRNRTSVVVVGNICITVVLGYGYIKDGLEKGIHCLVVVVLSSDGVMGFELAVDAVANF